jgi:alkylation response protein AidB-like acyl-CoA dehydrogenase
MDFDFTPEQLMLRNLAREILSRECSPSAVRQLMEDETGYSEALWGQLAETGLLGITIDEERGGQGLGMIEQALVLEEMGRAVYPGPYFATVTLAAAAIAAGRDRAQMDTYLPAIAEGKLKATFAYLENDASGGPGDVGLRARSQGGEYVLSGTKRFVPFAHVADLILVAARTTESSDPTRGITVFAVGRDAPGVSLSSTTGIDLTSKTSTVVLENVKVDRDAVIGRVDNGWSVLDATLRRASVGASAEMLGAARKCLEMSVEYAKVREQFGQPIGTFQAIKHALADMLLEVENAHAATYYAAWALDADAPDAALAASVAKSYVSEAARKVCGQAIQAHGGIGFTWEYDLHLPFKRAKHLEALCGDADLHRELVLREVLVPSAVPVLA